MLTKLYIDNFRCLVNFELHLKTTNLFLGDNGSGKSSVFAVLHRIILLVSGECKAEQVFKATDLTRWQKSTVQTFRLELSDGGGNYQYDLRINHDPDRKKSYIQYEALRLDGERLFTAEENSATLFRDEPHEDLTYPFDWSRSGLSAVHTPRDAARLMRFKTLISRMVLVHVVPTRIPAENSGEEESLSTTAGNFSAWFRHLSQEYQDKIITLTARLREILPGFRAFRLKGTGEDSRSLRLVFDLPGAERSEISLDFDELSDGQRVLIILYTLLYGVAGLDYSLFLDEPDNYLALPEVQPWLLAVSDAAGRELAQATFISHHPELINYLGESAGLWFERDGNGPVKPVRRLEEAGSDLKFSERLARGWVS
jgi:predicted ATPase